MSREPAVQLSEFEIHKLLWNGLLHSMVILAPGRESEGLRSGQNFHDELVTIVNGHGRIPAAPKMRENAQILAREGVLNEFKRADDRASSKHPRYFALSTYGRDSFFPIADAALALFAQLGFSYGRFLGDYRGSIGERRIMRRVDSLLSLYDSEVFSWGEQRLTEARAQGSLPTLQTTRAQISRRLGLSSTGQYKNIAMLSSLELITVEGEQATRYCLRLDAEAGTPKTFAETLDVWRYHSNRYILDAMEQARTRGAFVNGTLFDVNSLATLLAPFHAQKDDATSKRYRDALHAISQRLVVADLAEITTPTSYEAPVQLTERGKKLAEQFLLPLRWAVRNNRDTRYVMTPQREGEPNRFTHSAEIRHLLIDYLAFTRPNS
ncbi:MAG: hypothetical protein Q7S65_01090 [Nanoarchaeota archaeon]|nr:hypothetical protein [Nanoarchaeota archaeon]